MGSANGSIFLRVARVFEWSHKRIPIAFMFYSIATQARHDSFVVSFYLPVSSGIVCRGFQLFDA